MYADLVSQYKGNKSIVFIHVHAKSIDFQYLASASWKEGQDGK